MATRRRLKLGVGKERVTKPKWPSEAGYVASVNRQTKRITDKLLEFFDEMEDASEEIMLEALEPTYQKARRYTPVDTSALLNSSYLVSAPFRGKPRVEMGFAKGGSPAYAVFVHEIPYNHAEPTSWKFLERAMKEDLEDIYRRLGRGYWESFFA